MNFWMGYLFGVAGILFMVVVYTYFEYWLADYRKAKAKEIAKDKAEFGYCCGLEDGVCTFEPKLRKINEITIDAAEKK